MKIRFEEKMNKRYMVICPDKNESGFSAFRFRMILGNRIKGIVPCRTGNLDNRLMLYYNITGQIPVSDYLREHAADEEFLRRLLRELAAVTEELQRFLIGSESVFLEPERVFVSAETGTFGFTVWFEERNPFSENLLKLSEYLIPRLPNNNPAAAALGYELYQCCLSGSVAAQTLRKIAESDIGREAQARSESRNTEEGSLILSEDEIFTARVKKGKKKRPQKKETVKERLRRRFDTVKEMIRSFMRKLTEEEEN